MGIFKAIAGFGICTFASIGVGAFLYQKEFKKINFFILGSIAGFLFGFLFYSLVFVFFNTGSLIFLCIFVFIGMALVNRCAFSDEDGEFMASIFIGAYMIVRGLSFLLGGFPNEAEILTQLSDGN